MITTKKQKPVEKKILIICILDSHGENMRSMIKPHRRSNENLNRGQNNNAELMMFPIEKSEYLERFDVFNNNINKVMILILKKFEKSLVLQKRDMP